MRYDHHATFSYHQSLLFPDIEDIDFKLLRQSNIPRKVAVLSGPRGRRLGLAQHCCSILSITPNARKGGWMEIILVDPPVRDSFVSFRSDQQRAIISTPSQSLFGGIDDYITACSSFTKHNETSTSLFDKLLGYWKTGDLIDINVRATAMKALSHYPLRIIAAEWVNYLGLMGLSLRQYDRPPSNKETSTQELDRINLALKSVSSWPRRMASSLTGLRKCIAFIKHHGQNERPSDIWAALQEDYEHLATSLIQCGNQLEGAASRVTAYLQLAENRRMFSEARSVSRLTVLALVFVPLSFVSGLFSMNENMLPGGPCFWLYCAVAAHCWRLYFCLLSRPRIPVCGELYEQRVGFEDLLQHSRRKIDTHASIKFVSDFDE
ncbi:hypothetical protein F5Y16DRAFT_424700 [Xylariaceae sp. FL0255]|nr:hypothetical protein F5Y16DRAFT_424700 [Xylariaceae sp. FL0255]